MRREQHEPLTLIGVKRHVKLNTWSTSSAKIQIPGDWLIGRISGRLSSRGYKDRCSSNSQDLAGPLGGTWMNIVPSDLNDSLKRKFGSFV